MARGVVVRVLLARTVGATLAAAVDVAGAVAVVLLVVAVL